MAAKKKPAPIERAAPPTEAESRISVVLLAMASGTYGSTRGERTAQRKAWAKQWGIAESSVYHYTAEAWRRLREHPGLAAQVMEAVTEILEEGTNTERLQAAKQLSAIIGMDAPKKVEVSEDRSQNRHRVIAWLTNPNAELLELLEEALSAKGSKLPRELEKLGFYRKEVVEA